MAKQDKELIAAYSYLVIDDEEFIRNLISRILKNIGAQELRMANSGAEALSTIDIDGAPDLLLCDLNMPGMDGVQFLRHLVDIGFMGGIILISGEDERILETAVQLGKAQNLNILGALSKPITPVALSELIAKFGENHQAFRPRPSVDISVEELQSALNSNKLTAYYQPKVSVKTRKLVGVETLVRWIHPEKGFIPPDAFVHIAEDNGLIDQLTDAVFRTAMVQGGEWLTQGLDLKVAVNLSVDNLNRLDLPEFIVDIAQQSGMNPQNVILEITETRLMEDIIKPLEILTRFRLKRLGLSIDDFGTGHSSMEQLKRIPFTELKIDQAFVHGATKNSTARAILESSASLAKSMNISTVAEGVEDQEDWDIVAKQNIDVIQGYFVAKPMPPEEFNDWQTDWQTD